MGTNLQRPLLARVLDELRRPWMIVLTLVLAMLALRQYGFSSYFMPSGSMYPTICIEERFFVSRSAYGLFSHDTPARGDIIVFDYPDVRPGEEPQQFIKRVAARAGDTIEVRGGRPRINGWLVPQCPLSSVTAREGKETKTFELFVEFLDGSAYVVAVESGTQDFAFGPYKVDENEVFVLGDNRGNSSDSRAWSGGRGRGVPLDTIYGRAFMIWSPRFGVSLRKEPVLPPLAHPPTAALAACLAKRPKLEDTKPPPPKAP